MKKIFYFFMTAIMAMAVASCSKDDEPGDFKPTYDGVSIYLNAIETFYDNTGKPAFTPTGVEGIYAASASSYSQSAAFIANLIENKDWDGKDVTVKLGQNGEEGSLRIIGETQALISQGIYNKIVVDIKGYTPSYTLEIITEEKADNGYGEGIVIKKLEDVNP